MSIIAIRVLQLR